MVFIGLGSNLGDRSGSLRAAIGALEAVGVRSRLRSSVYRADPVEVLNQGEFLNQVIGCEAARRPEDLLEICSSIERAMGRVRRRKGGPRVIDLDILLQGDLVRNDGQLVLPHPRMHLRRFVLLPLAEIAPGVRHPILKRSVRELLERCPDRSRVERIVAPFGRGRL